MQARRAATEMADRVVARIAAIELPPNVAAEVASNRAGDDVLARLKKTGLVQSGFVIGADGKLLWPAPVKSIPRPVPLNVGELSATQQEGWFALEDQFALDDPEAEAVDLLLTEFIRTQPPQRFASVATVRVAALARKTGNVVRSRELLQPLTDPASEMAGETGIPLHFVAALHLAEIGSDRAREGILDQVCGEAVAEGSPLSEALIERATALSSGMARWMDVWNLHQEARNFYASTVSSPELGFADVEGTDWLTFARPAEGGTWVLGIPLVAAKAVCLELQQGSAGATRFRTRVAIGDRLVLGGPRTDEPLGVASRVIPVFNGELPLRLETWLADRESFYAQQRTRSRRFGALIAASAVAVFIGFFAAWRAFRRQQQLSEMKTNFVSSVSHELRAPIASVRLMAEELAEGESPSPEKQKQYHHFIGQECRRLSAVIENVLDFSRREQGRETFEFEPTDLKMLVGETVELMRAYAEEKDVRLKVVQLDHFAIVEADGRALHRLLVNLVDNAIKHSPPDSTVRIGTEVDRAMTRLWVEDDGPGIPSSEHGRIFERFYRIGSELRRETQGVGLGLSIVKHIAEVHGGKVTVCSAVGEGSRFVVELPLRIVDTASVNGAIK